VIEVLSPGAANERRDREATPVLYGRSGVREYWIMDWRRRQVQCCRRAQEGLHPATTMIEDELLQSPLLPGFPCPVRVLFARVSR